MSFEWNETKCAENIRDRHIDFRDVLELFDNPEVVVFEDDRKDYGEPRFILLGLLREKLYQVVFTPRGRNIRIISARRANKRERRLYDELRDH
jgi:hypothetical protein